MELGVVMAVPEFPAAVLASDADPGALEAARPVDERASDYQWLSLKCWNPDAEVSRRRGALVIGFTDYHDDAERFYGFSGGDDPVAVASELLDRAEARGWAPELRMVPWSTALQLVDDFDVSADRDNDDYLYDPVAVVALEGAAHRLNRKQRGGFRRTYDGLHRITVHDPASAPWNRLVEFTEEWASSVTDAAAAADETKAVIRCCNVLELHGAGRDVFVTTLEVGDHMVGFDISEVCGDGWAMNHFRHTDRFRRGAHVELRTAVASWLVDRGVRAWNAEQDLGVDGLRARKLRDRPDGFIRKFVVRRPGTGPAQA